MGGGDSVFAARRFRVRVRVVYAFISAGGMVGFLPGQTLPVVESMRATARR
jgi:3-phosphoglycerate kinase